MGIESGRGANGVVNKEGVDGNVRLSHAGDVNGDVEHENTRFTVNVGICRRKCEGDDAGEMDVISRDDDIIASAGDVDNDNGVGVIAGTGWEAGAI